MGVVGNRPGSVTAGRPISNIARRLTRFRRPPLAVATRALTLSGPRSALSSRNSSYLARTVLTNGSERFVLELHHPLTPGASPPRSGCRESSQDPRDPSARGRMRPRRGALAEERTTLSRPLSCPALAELRKPNARMDPRLQDTRGSWSRMFLIP